MGKKLEAKVVRTARQKISLFQRSQSKFNIIERYNQLPIMQDKVPAGIIPLTELTIVQPNDKMGKDNCFELQADKRIYYFFAGKLKNAFILKMWSCFSSIWPADKLEDMESWMNALLKVTVGWQQQATPAPVASEVRLRLHLLPYSHHHTNGA